MSTRFTALLCVLTICILVACGVRTGQAQGQTQPPAKAPPSAAKITDKQLEQWLKQFPDADIDKNGKLTRNEAVNYWLKLQQEQLAAEKQRTPPTAADVKYGPYERNVLDFWQTKSQKPTPVLINFHGGGFVGGDKSAVSVEPNLRQGMSVVSANYRFVKGGPESAPYPAPMYDGARVVQFVRSKAKEWNIDPNRIVLTGSSAGAIMAMWIAYNDDLAQPDSSDPIARHSSRVACILPISGPTSLDPDFIRREIGGNPIVHPSINPFFGVETEAELKTEEKQRLIREASPLTLVSSDDPPTFLLYGGELTKTPLAPDTNVSISIHHARFGVLMKEQLDKAGVANELAYLNDGRTKLEQMAALQAFLKKHLLE